MAFLETGAFVGLVAPGRDGGDRRRRDRGAGRDRPAPADRARVGLRRARRHHELLHRPPPRAQLPRAPRAAGEDHARAPRAGGGLLRPSRRQDDPDRPLHRPRARARAVHRRGVGAAPTGASSPSASSAPASGPRRSACSATSSGARSTRWRTSPGRRCSPSASPSRVIVARRGGLPAAGGDPGVADRTRAPPAGAAAVRRGAAGSPRAGASVRAGPGARGALPADRLTREARDRAWPWRARGSTYSCSTS